MRRKGFTLVEVLIAISIFSLSAVIASSVLVSVVQLEKKASIPVQDRSPTPPREGLLAPPPECVIPPQGIPLPWR